MSAKKSGGLAFNPLLARTDETPPAPETQTPAGTRLPADTHTRARAGMPAVNEEAAGAQPVDEVGERNSKFTFYFTPQQLDRLDIVWQQLRQRQRRRSGVRRPSKSRFVRIALDRLLDDFDRNPEQVMQLLNET